MKKRVLFIADNPILSDRLAVTMREAGYEVLHAEDEAGADSLPDSPVPDLLLIDLDLQSTSSWDIYAECKARHPRLRTVAVTGVPNRFGVTRAVGIDALMEKPVEPSLLLLVIASVLDEAARVARADMSGRPDFRYLTSADTRYWRSLRGRRARASQYSAASVCV